MFDPRAEYTYTAEQCKLYWAHLCVVGPKIMHANKGPGSDLLSTFHQHATAAGVPDAQANAQADAARGFAQLAHSAFAVCVALGAASYSPESDMSKVTVGVMRGWLRDARAFDAEHGEVFASLGEDTAKLRNETVLFESLVRKQLEHWGMDVQG